MADSKHNRRDFLRGKAALAAAADVVEELVDSRLSSLPDPEVKRRGERVVTLTRRAMACDFELRIVVSADENDTAAGMAALDTIERVEDQLTVYRDESDLVELNRRAAHKVTPVEPNLFGLLELCDRLHADTLGAFDPTSGPLSRVWGFHRRQGEVPDEASRLEALGRVGWKRVQLDRAEQTVRFERDDIDLNANSIGKGYALDRAAETLADHDVRDAFLHGGRSTLLARGDNRLLEGGGWIAGLRDPLRPERRLAELTLHDEALSTSGAGTQFFKHAGRRYGHVIDPRTGWPAEGLYSASVIAPTAAEADALSTAAYVLGVEGTRELCQRRPELRALLIAPDESCDNGPEGVAVHAFNLPEEAWRPRERG